MTDLVAIAVALVLIETLVVFGLLYDNIRLRKEMARLIVAKIVNDCICECNCKEEPWGSK